MSGSACVQWAGSWYGRASSGRRGSEESNLRELSDILMTWSDRLVGRCTQRLMRTGYAQGST